MDKSQPGATKSQTKQQSNAVTRLILAIQKREAVCCVIGLGFIGSGLMRELVAAGFEVHGYDRSDRAVERFRSTGISSSSDKTWTAGTDESVIGRADVIIVAIRAFIEPNGSTDLEPLKAVAHAISNQCRKECLVLLESTVSPGTTRAFADGLLRKVTDFDVLVAHTPERLQMGNSPWTLANTPHLVGGLDANCTQVATEMVSVLCNDVVPVSSPEVSELSKLVENTFMAVGIGFIAEITRLAHALGIAASDVTEAAATKPFGYYPFHPGPGIGGHCIPNDLQILRHAFEGRTLSSALLDATADVTVQLPMIVIDRLEGLLAERDTDLNGTRILLLGVGFKIGSPDTTETPAACLVRLLRERQATPLYADSQVESFAVDGIPVERVTGEQLSRSAIDAGLVLSGDSNVDARELERAVPLLLDTGGGRIVPGKFIHTVRL